MSKKTWVAAFALMIAAKKGVSIVARVRRKLTGYQRPANPASMPVTLPRTVWIYWDKGEAEAPALVRRCIASWRNRNPGWDVRVLSAADAAGTAGLSDLPEDLPVQSFADLLRLRLLSRHGGVWADATLYCVKPLDHWLPVVAQKGFFAFTWTETDRWMIWPDLRRTLTNWFLAAAPGNPVIGIWEAKGFAYWEGRTRPHVYYWPHMLVDFLSLTDRRFARALRDMPRLGCYGPHLVHDALTRGGDPAQIRGLLEAGVAPIQKLRWNWDDETVSRLDAILPAD